MHRRVFIKVVAGSAAAWAFAAGAQQADRVRRIGALMALAEDDSEGQARLAAFLRGLQEAGWVAGRNVQIDYRWGAGDADRTRRYVAELVALAPDVILGAGSLSLGPLLQTTRIVPIVFVHVPDPVGAKGSLGS